MPADWCPFCPGSGRVPDAGYDVLIYPNDFPAFEPGEPFDPRPGLFSTTGAPGACDVVLYSPQHSLRPSELSVDQWLKVVDLWTRRTAELARLDHVQYVMAFENTGEAVGVTMPHPHGQIYAFPFLPPLVETELESARAHSAAEGRCLYCDILDREIADEKRVVWSSRSFTAFVPFAARFPNELHIYPRRHLGSLQDLDPSERRDLAEILSIVRQKYDNLYGFLLPLMMAVREAPPRGSHPYFHFHLEFLPLQRSAKKLKYLAAVETAAGTYLADTRAEDRAAELRRSAPVTES